MLRQHAEAAGAGHAGASYFEADGLVLFRVLNLVRLKPEAGIDPGEAAGAGHGEATGASYVEAAGTGPLEGAEPGHTEAWSWPC